jgi:methionine sulfoxide reductase heme-binding subunit
MHHRRSVPFWVALHLAALSPLAVLLWNVADRQLGPDWVGEVTRRTGRYALALLLLSLAPGAANRLLAWPGLLRLRRVLGLYAFAYAALHLLAYAGIDYGFDLALLLAGLPASPFVLVGLAALLLLLPLAVTSTDGWVRRLGRNWRRLHRLVYLAGVLAVWHYAWRSKELRPSSLWIAALLGVLLLARLLPTTKVLGGKSDS